MAKFAAKFAGEVCWRSLPAKCAARHPAKDTAKFRRNFVRVVLPSRKFHRKFHRNQEPDTSSTEERRPSRGKPGWALGIVVLTSQSPLRMLRSHSRYCSGLYRKRLAIVHLLCKFLAVALKTLIAADGHARQKVIIAIVPHTFEGKKPKIPRIKSGKPQSHNFQRSRTVWAPGVLCSVRGNTALFHSAPYTRKYNTRTFRPKQELPGNVVCEGTEQVSSALEPGIYLRPKQNARPGHPPLRCVVEPAPITFGLPG